MWKLLEEMHDWFEARTYYDDCICTKIRLLQGAVARSTVSVPQIPLGIDYGCSVPDEISLVRIRAHLRTLRSVVGASDQDRVAFRINSLIGAINKSFLVFRRRRKTQPPAD